MKYPKADWPTGSGLNRAGLPKLYQTDRPELQRWANALGELQRQLRALVHAAMCLAALLGTEPDLPGPDAIARAALGLFDGWTLSGVESDYDGEFPPTLILRFENRARGRQAKLTLEDVNGALNPEG